MSGTWSERIEQHYSLRLPRDVRAWLDQQVWRETGGAEFCRARTPEQLLDPEPGTIWAGFMLPDTLPFIGNDYGDWLCLRIAADGTVSELVHWSHCGGDWIPYGRSLSEGLLYDAAQQVLDPQRPSLTGVKRPAHQVFQLAQWARAWITSRDEMISFWDLPSDAEPLADASVLDLLLDCRIAEFAVRRDRILGALESPLKRLSNPQLARRLGVAWEPDFVSWLFDTRRVPEPVHCQLGRQLDIDQRELMAQDWATAQHEAAWVIQQRSDLGWAFDIAGWAAERRGDWGSAVSYYLSGLQTSWFSDDTVRFRTHWFEEGYGKFAASRLAMLTGHLTPAQHRNPYLAIFLDNDPQTLRGRVQAHWLAKAREAERRQDYTLAYQYYYRAGWDLGLQSVGEYGEVFDGMCRAAQAAGMSALAAVAQTHQRFLVRPD